MNTGNGLRKISSALYGVIIICFFLPFIEVSCSGNTVLSITGMQMVTGDRLEPNNDLFGGVSSKQERIEPQAWAIAAILLTVAAFIFSLKNITGKIKQSLPPALFSGAAILSLLMLRSKIDTNLSKETFNVITIHYVYGFWLAVILLGAALLLNLLLLKGNTGETS